MLPIGATAHASREEFYEALYFRNSMEIELAKRLVNAPARVATVALQMDHALAKMKIAMGCKDVNSFLTHDHSFHLAMAHFPFAREALQPLLAVVRGFLAKLIDKKHSLMRVIYEEHESIRKAIESVPLRESQLLPPLQDHLNHIFSYDTGCDSDDNVDSITYVI
jgi:DNA-binding GntR family transcriptional regulator